MTSLSFIRNNQLFEMKKDALTNKPEDLKIVYLVGLTLRLCRTACKSGLLSMEEELHYCKDAPGYYIDFVKMVCDGSDPDYIIEYASVMYYLNHDRGERFRIFVSLYLLLFLQDGCRDLEIWYFAKLLMKPGELDELDKLDVAGCFDGSTHDDRMHDRVKHYLNQEEVGKLLSGDI